jgi:hypothetical protein
MNQRLPVILSSTALLVAVFGATPLGHAAGQLVQTVPPFAKRAGYAARAGVAANALALNGHKASTTPGPGTIPLLDAQGKLPAPIGLGRTAFAVVDPNGGSPRFIAERTSGFLGVSSPFAGDYCLTPAPGVDLASTAAVASEEAPHSDVFGLPVVRYPTPAAENCRADQLEVKTLTDNPVQLSSKIAFAVIIP